MYILCLCQSTHYYACINILSIIYFLVESMSGVWTAISPINAVTTATAIPNFIFILIVCLHVYHTDSHYNSCPKNTGKSSSFFVGKGKNLVNTMLCERTRPYLVDSQEWYLSNNFCWDAEDGHCCKRAKRVIVKLFRNTTVVSTLVQPTGWKLLFPVQPNEGNAAKRCYVSALKEY